MATKEEIIESYLEFKKKCIDNKIIDKDEIFKLFEVWLHLLEST